jgi:hypothetical protein
MVKIMEDLSNTKFGSLTPLEPIYKYRREWVWLCNCDCGKQTKVRISKLRNGYTRSCGCIRVTPMIRYGPENRDWEGHGEISKTFYSRIKRTAKLRKLRFNVTIEYLWNLFIKQNRLCVYTGNKLLMPINVRQLRGENNEDIASLDRINNDNGYIIGNVQWVCKRVNYMKHTMTHEYFISWIKLIYEHRKT